MAQAVGHAGKCSVGALEACVLCCSGWGAPHVLGGWGAPHMLSDRGVVLLREGRCRPQP